MSDLASRDEMVDPTDTTSQAPKTSHAPTHGAGTTGCGRCPQRWGGLRTAHCGAEKSRPVALFPLRDGDPLVGANVDVHRLEGSVDRGGITGQCLADLVSAPALNDVKLRRFNPPQGAPVFESVIFGGQWSKVLWSVVSDVPVHVVNVLSVRDSSIENPVLIGFDVLVGTNFPTKSDVAVTGDVPTRLVLRDSLTRREVVDRSEIPRLSTGGAVAALSGTFDGASAHGAILDGHEASLHVTALCHQTFTAPSAFDKHRDGDHAKGTRHCLPPGSVGLVDAGRQYLCWRWPGGEDDRWGEGDE